MVDKAFKPLSPVPTSIDLTKQRDFFPTAIEKLWKNSTRVFDSVVVNGNNIQVYQVPNGKILLLTNLSLNVHTSGLGSTSSSLSTVKISDQEIISVYSSDTAVHSNSMTHQFNPPLFVFENEKIEASENITFGTATCAFSGFLIDKDRFYKDFF